MKSTTIGMAILFCFLAGCLAARAETKPKVIDLGQLEVEGELRRPNTQWIDSGKPMQAMLPGLYEREFLRLENRITRPLTRDEFLLKTEAPSSETIQVPSTPGGRKL